MSVIQELKELPYYHTLEDSARVIRHNYLENYLEHDSILCPSLDKIILVLFILAGLYGVDDERLKHEFQYRISCSESELEQEIYTVLNLDTQDAKD